MAGIYKGFDGSLGYHFSPAAIICNMHLVSTKKERKKIKGNSWKEVKFSRFEHVVGTEYYIIILLYRTRLYDTVNSYFAMIRKNLSEEHA